MRKSFYIKGMHCSSCEIIIKKELDNLKDLEVNLAKQEISFEGDITKEEINKKIEKFGYTAIEKNNKESINTNKKELLLPLILAITVIIIFLLFQKIGIINKLNISSITFPSAFLIGIIASLSTCMAVVGGLILTISTSYAKTGKAKKPLIIFHISRLVAFFILGGLLGIVGEFFKISPTFYLITGFLLAIAMFIIGINLLELFPVFRNLQPKFTKDLFLKASKTKNIRNILMPILLATLSFFLPCGFTQSMQLFAISSGNMITGALTMLVFALGTLPVLALISFGSSQSIKTAKSKTFSQTMGFLLIAFALFNTYSLLVSTGIIANIF